MQLRALGEAVSDGEESNSEEESDDKQDDSSDDDDDDDDDDKDDDEEEWEKADKKGPSASKLRFLEAQVTHIYKDPFPQRPAAVNPGW